MERECVRVDFKNKIDGLFEKCNSFSKMIEDYVPESSWTLLNNYDNRFIIIVHTFNQMSTKTSRCTSSYPSYIRVSAVRARKLYFLSVKWSHKHFMVSTVYPVRTQNVDHNLLWYTSAVQFATETTSTKMDSNRWRITFY